jgi:predicted nucleotidyltransferase
MRLTQEQVQWITQTVSRLTGEGAEVYLFGSRLNEKAKGGDVDLFIETDAPLTLLQRAQIKMELETQLELSVDIVSQTRNTAPTAFQTIAREGATQLGV